MRLAPWPAPPPSLTKTQLPRPVWHLFRGRHILGHLLLQPIVRMSQLGQTEPLLYAEPRPGEIPGLGQGHPGETGRLSRPAVERRGRAAGEARTDLGGCSRRPCSPPCRMALMPPDVAGRDQPENYRKPGAGAGGAPGLRVLEDRLNGQGGGRTHGSISRAALSLPASRAGAQAVRSIKRRSIHRNLPIY